MRVWVDGVLLGGQQEGLAPCRPAPDSASAGDGVFTTVLVRDGRAMAWGRHMRRLSASMATLALGELDESLVDRASRQALGERRPGDVRLRLLVTRGEDGLVHLSVQTGGLGQQAPVARVVTPTVRRTSRAAGAGLKSTQYAENLLAAGVARRAGADECLLLDERGRLSEGTGSNVFHVVGGELRTPALSTGCLPGIARELVLEWCEVREVEDAAHVAHAADELFLTSVTREVQPVAEWGGRAYPAPGPVTVAVLEAWRRGFADPGEWHALV